jgi:hypothetical protein
MQDDPIRDPELETLLETTYLRAAEGSNRLHYLSKVNALGRNDRCLCNSGKKVKTCCLPSSKAEGVRLIRLLKKTDQTLVKGAYPDAPKRSGLGMLAALGAIGWQ